jgi:hypothetical protein
MARSIEQDKLSADDRKANIVFSFVPFFKSKQLDL